jgi:NADPH:quinone reductase-like Zn-dependent oxidoreductase/SAM-dependent methyltransferase
MAIEASRQLAGGTKVTSFQLRKIIMKRALIVPDTKEGIEVSLSLATVDDQLTGSRTWRRFQITSYNASSDEWAEHCNGLITVEHELPLDPVDNRREAKEDIQAWKADLAHANQKCDKPINFKTTYNNLQTSGLNFGPLFRNLGEVRGSGSRLGRVVGSVIVPDIAQSMPKQFMHSHLIHPATMDSMIHMMIAAVLDFTGNPTLDQIRLPTFIREVWISADLNATPAHKFTGHATVSVMKSGKFEGQIRMLGEGSDTERIRMDGIELTPLESGLAESSERQLCSAIEYKPDLHFLDSRTACEVTSVGSSYEVEALYWVKRLQLATMIYVTDTLALCQDLDVTTLDSHMQRFIEWMKHMKGKLLRNEIIHLPYSEFQEVSQDEFLKEAIDKEIEEHSAEGAITARMGRNIYQVIRGQTDPLHLMFGQDNVMEQVYKEGLNLYNLPQHLRSHLSLLRHQHCELKVLEIGGGTGSFTAEILAVLCPDPTKSRGSIAKYTFTDISSGFFEKAKQRFQPWSNIMKFQSLNIERNAAGQGLQLGEYDLIFAGNVIHATANLQNTLQNLSSLLKPGGQLIMQEGIRQDFLWYPLVFGQLPGWWLGDEPCRQWCPYIPTEDWDDILVKAGFSGVDIEYPSSNNPDLTWQSILVSSTPTATQARRSKVNMLIVTTLSPRTRNIILFLRQHLQEIGYGSVNIVPPSELHTYVLSGVHCISLIDMECQYLTEMDTAQYNGLKDLLNGCENLLWITAGPEASPHASMSLGLLRTVRWERDSDGSNIIILTVSEQELAKQESAIFSRNIEKIAKHQFLNLSNDRHAEYLLRDGVIHIGRLSEWTIAEQFLGERSSKLYPQLQHFGDIDYPIELQETAAGTGEYHWVADPQHELLLADTEVEIEIRAFGLSPSPSGSALLNEAAGIVIKVGSRVKSTILGERVAFISAPTKGGRLRTHERVDHLLIAKIPDEMSFEIAAQLASAYTTQSHAINCCGDFDSEDTVLIHNGAMAVSQAAIQFAQRFGSKIFATVATPEERDLLVSEYKIPKEHIFSSRDLTFAKGVMRYTNGQGVNFIFNNMSGEALQASLACLASHGQFIDVAQKDARIDHTVDLASLSRNISIHKIDILSMAESRPKKVRDQLEHALALYSNDQIGQIRGSTVMDLTQIKEGLQSIQNGRSAKVVFIPDSSSMVPVVPRSTTPYQFEHDATYVLAGGYGGLGRSLARWMASRGAKNLIFLSRSSASSPEKREMVTDLKRIGCKVINHTCDVSDRSSLEALSGNQFSHLPPIKGCIQASMVLKVSPHHPGQNDKT